VDLSLYHNYYKSAHHHDFVHDNKDIP
jgi:hypothetical protein